MVRMECALALVALEGATAKEAIPFLLHGLGEGDFLIQTRCEEALAALGEMAIPALLRVAQALPLHFSSGKEERVTLRTRLTAIRLLGKRRDRRSAPVLCALMHDPEAQIRSEIIQALRWFSPSQVVFTVVEAAQHDPSRAVRAVARKVLKHWRQEGLPLPEPASVWCALLQRLWSQARGRRDPPPITQLSAWKKKNREQRDDRVRENTSKRYS
jgi:HEAT repeat protein